VKVVEPNDITVLEPSTAKSTLTLVTCYPFYFLGPAPNRFIVHARKN
jgi:sortase A